MSKAKNAVIAGDYKGAKVKTALGSVSIGAFPKPVVLSKKTVISYELVTDEHRKSAASGIAKGLAGSLLFGFVGGIAGASSAKTKGIYQVALEFENGKRSLVEVDEKTYKAIVKSCF